MAESSTYIDTGARTTTQHGYQATATTMARCTNGNLWMVFPDGTSTLTDSVDFWYSTDDGATWNNPGASSHFGYVATTGSTYVEPTLFIDQDDYAHVCYSDRSNGHVYYRRGTPNVDRTAWTWSSPTLIDNNSAYSDEATCVAHREGTGWKVHILNSRLNSSAADAVHYTRLDITSGGVVSVEVANQLVSAASHGNFYNKRPTIDFHHTGDGKTVKDGAPHLFIAWSVGNSGGGLYFRKATYSGGTWTWGSIVTLDPGYRSGAANYSTNGFWDVNNNRFVVGGYFVDNIAGGSYIGVLARDLDDTTTTELLREANALSGNDTSMNYGSIACDAVGNIYAIGSQSSANSSGVARLVIFRIVAGDLRECHTVFTPLTYTLVNARCVNYGPENTLNFMFIDVAVSPYTLYAGQYTYAPPVEVAIALGTAIETDTGPDFPDPNSYPLVGPTYRVTDTRRRPYVNYEQGLTLVKMGGTWTALTSPPAEVLTAAGEEGVGWFRGGHEYLVPGPLAEELEAAGFTVDRTQPTPTQ